MYHLRVWRAGTLLTNSEKAAAVGDWDSAGRTALAAWQLHPGDVEVLRQLFRASRERNATDALPAGRALFAHPQSDHRDRSEVIRVFFAAGDLVTVSNLFSHLPEDERKSPDILELRARFLISRGRPFEALPLIDQLRMAREEKGDLLLAANALSLINSKDRLARTEAQRIIDELFVPGNEAGIALKAFLLLRQIPTEEWQISRFADAGERLAAIAKRSPVPPAVWLLADELRISLDPGRREEFLLAAVLRWREAAPEALGEWLLNQNAADFFNDHLSSLPTASSPEWLELKVRARLMRSEWDEALGLLNEASPAIDPVVVLALRAMIGAGMGGRDLEAGRHWEQALRLAELAGRRDSFLRLGGIAALAGNTRIRILAVTEALKRNSGPALPASQVSFVFGDLVEQNQSDDLLTVSRNLLASEPGNPQLLNNVVWLELLQGKSNEARVEGLAAFVERFPSITGLRTTLALARLNQERYGEALRLLEPVIDQIETSEKLPSAADLAVAAYALAQSGETERAAKVVDRVKWEELLSAEREFFRSAFHAAQMVSEPEHL